MSLLYIVDGYNVINSTPLFKNKKLRDARSALFSYISQRRPHGSLRNRLIVVFDGRTELQEFKQSLVFEVVFARGCSADEQIKELAGACENPKNVVVVTDDKGLARGVRSGGAKVMDTNTFLNKKARQKAQKVDSWDGEVSELNIVQREKITEELRRLWLDKNGKKGAESILD